MDHTKEMSIATAEIIANQIYVKITENGMVHFPFCWYRDNCRCQECFNFETLQRKKHILDIPENSIPRRIQIENGVLITEWDDDHVSKHSAEVLWECWPANWQHRGVTRQLWSGNIIKDKIASVDKDSFLKCDETLKAFLQSLVDYGVACVENVKPTVDDTELVIKRVAPVQRTLFGDMWTFTSNQERADSAYTNTALASHNDNTYLTEAAGLQVFHCLEHDGTGGETTLVDGFYVADELKRSDPEAYKMLTTTHQPGEYIETGWYHSSNGPVIKINERNKQIEQIRFNIYDRSSHCVTSNNDLPKWYKSLRKISKMCASSETQCVLKLNPGKVLFIDNWRVLHGRTSFTGKRVLGGAYVSRGDWLSAARVHGLVPAV